MMPSPRDLRKLSRNRHPHLEALELRDLPSGPAVLARGAPPALTRYLANATSHLAHAQTSPAQPTAMSSPTASKQALIASFAASVYGPVTAPDGTVYTDVPQPTAAEIRRETFVSAFVGNYSVGPPRAAGRGPTIYIASKGDNAGSNQFLKSRAQLLILPPSDPNATPNPSTDPIAGQVVGIASYVTSNFLETSGNLLFDLTNIPGVASNDPSALSHGFPSRLSWTLDQAGAGIYTSPTYTFDTFLASSTPGIAPGGTGGAAAWQAGAGEVDLTYHPDRHPRPGTLESGTVTVRFVGLFNNPGDLNSINRYMNQ